MKQDKNVKVKCKKIRKGDKVIAIAGNDRDSSGTVLSVHGDRAVVQGLNVRKKHVKRQSENAPGGIIDIEKSMHISNLCVCTDDEKPLKLKVRFNDEGERELYYRDGEQSVLYRRVKKS